MSSGVRSVIIQFHVMKTTHLEMSDKAHHVQTMGPSGAQPC